MHDCAVGPLEEQHGGTAAVDETNKSRNTISDKSKNPPHVISEDIFKQILVISDPLPYRKDEEVVVKGSQSQCVYYVEKGSVEISYTMQDTKIVVTVIGEGNFFGEIGFFDGISRVRDIRAAEDSIIRTFTNEQIENIQQRDPLLYSNFVTFMARSICAKFRLMLEEREPLNSYAASLSTGRRAIKELKPLPAHFLGSYEWRLMNSIVESLKSGFFNLSYQLQRESTPQGTEDEQQQCKEMLDRFNEQIQDFEHRLNDPEKGDYAWGFLFKELFPFLMRSRLAERSYYKPKGYAGDFLMMEMLYNNQPEGDGKLGLLVDEWFLNTTASKAVRSRRNLLTQYLHSLCGEKLPVDGKIRIMNLACGSSRELFDFLSLSDYTEKIEATCVDADQEALEYIDRYVNVMPHKAYVRLMQDNVVKWSLGRVRHHLELQDIIYSVGLTDYLDVRLFQALAIRCYEHLKPGGVFIVGNFGAYNPNKVLMDHVLNWELIHRSEKDLLDLFASTPFGENIEVVSEEQKVNLFAVATKSP